MARIIKNLSLDPEAVERGEQYSRLHATSLSQVVSDLLSQLPVEQDLGELAPIAKSLLGAAAGSGSVDDYHTYLEEKYLREAADRRQRSA